MLNFDFKLKIFQMGNRFKEILMMPTGRYYNLDFFALTNTLISSLPHDLPEPPVRLQLYKDVLTLFTKRIGATVDFLLGPASINKDDKQLLNNELILSKEILQAANNLHFERPILLSLQLINGNNEDRLNFEHEFLFIKDSTTLWLAPEGKGRLGSKNRKTPSQRYADGLKHADPFFIDDLSILSTKWLLENADVESPECQRLFTIMGIYEAYSKRSRQVSNQLIDVQPHEIIHKSSRGQFKHLREKPITAEFYISQNGLFPLIWSEIAYAVRNNIFIQTCPICYKRFPMVKGKYNQKYCSEVCSAEAERKADKERVNFNKIKALQMRRTRAKSQEEKDKLTVEIRQLKMNQ